MEGKVTQSMHIAQWRDTGLSRLQLSPFVSFLEKTIKKYATAIVTQQHCTFCPPAIPKVCIKEYISVIEGAAPAILLQRFDSPNLSPLCLQSAEVG